MKSSLAIFILFLICISYCTHIKGTQSYRLRNLKASQGTVRGFGVPNGYQRKIKEQAVLKTPKASNPFIPYKIVENSEATYNPLKSSTLTKDILPQDSSKLKNSDQFSRSDATAGSSSPNEETSIYRKLSFIFAILLFTLVIIFVKFSNISSVMRGKNSMSEYISKKYKESSSSNGSSKDGYEEESVKLINSEKQSCFPGAYNRHLA